MYLELIDAFHAFCEDDRASIGVITGAGDRAFCAGIDLRTAERSPLAAPSAAPSAAPAGRSASGCEVGLDYFGPGRELTTEKILIAAINGDTHSIGLEWACLADFRIAEEHASFRATAERRDPGWVEGRAVCLPRIIGRERARELSTTGRVLDAREALQIGLVNEIVPRGCSLSRSVDLARRISMLSPR